MIPNRLPGYAQLTSSSRSKQTPSRSNQEARAHYKHDFYPTKYGSVPYVDNMSGGPTYLSSACDEILPVHAGRNSDESEALELLRRQEQAREADAQLQGEEMHELEKRPRDPYESVNDPPMYLPVGGGGAGMQLEELRHTKYSLRLLKDRLLAQDKELRHRDMIVRTQEQRQNQLYEANEVAEEELLLQQRDMRKMKQMRMLQDMEQDTMTREKENSLLALQDITSLTDLAQQQEQEHVLQNQKKVAEAAELISKGHVKQGKQLLDKVQETVSQHKQDLMYPLQADSRRVNNMLLHAKVSSEDRGMNVGSIITTMRSSNADEGVCSNIGSSNSDVKINKVPRVPSSPLPNVPTLQNVDNGDIIQQPDESHVQPSLPATSLVLADTSLQRIRAMYGLDNLQIPDEIIHRLAQKNGHIVNDNDSFISTSSSSSIHDITSSPPPSTNQNHYTPIKLTPASSHSTPVSTVVTPQKKKITPSSKKSPILSTSLSKQNNDAYTTQELASREQRKVLDEAKEELPTWQPPGVKSQLLELQTVQVNERIHDASKNSVKNVRSVKALIVALCTMFNAFTDRKLMEQQTRFERDMAALRRKMDHARRHEDVVQQTERGKRVVSRGAGGDGCKCAQNPCVCYEHALFRKAKGLCKDVTGERRAVPRSRSTSPAAPRRNGSDSRDLWLQDGPGVQDCALQEKAVLIEEGEQRVKFPKVVFDGAGNVIRTNFNQRHQQKSQLQGITQPDAELGEEYTNMQKSVDPPVDSNSVKNTNAKTGKSSSKGKTPVRKDTTTHKSDPIVLAAALNTVKQLAERAEEAEKKQKIAEQKNKLLEHSMEQMKLQSNQSASILLRKMSGELEHLQFGLMNALVKYRDNIAVHAAAQGVGTTPESSNSLLVDFTSESVTEQDASTSNPFLRYLTAQSDQLMESLVDSVQNCVRKVETQVAAHHQE